LPGGSNGKDLGGIGGSKLALANGKKVLKNKNNFFLILLISD